MEKEPLLPYPSPRIPQPPPQPPELFPVPEHDEISVSIPACLSRSELKERLIFGPSSPSSNLQSPTFIDALALSLNSPRSPAPPFLDPSKTITEKQKSWLDVPNCGSDKSSLHRSKTAPAMAAINDFVHPLEGVGKPPQFNSSSIIRQAIMLLVCYLIFGVTIFWWNNDNFRGTQTHPIVDALYFCIVTMCTIGYGDITPQSSVTKLFSIMFVLVGFGFIDILLSGMVSYVLDLQERYLLKNIKSGGAKEKNPNSYIIDVKKGRMRIRLKVGVALGVVVLCIGVGAVFMHNQEHLGWLDSFYLSVMSVTTVGYGDRAFNSMGGRIFASVWLLVSTLAVARAFLYLAEARVDKRQRHMAQWVLGQDMTVSQFLAADIDHNGFVSKAEYVIYKLKEMGKVSEKEIMQVGQTFDRLDTGNCGKISLYEFLESHQ